MRRRVAETVAVSGFSAFLVALKLCEYLSFHVDDFDTGIYSNVVWNVANGAGFYSDVLRTHHLGEHFSPIMAVFAPLYAFAPSALWLLVAQALAVGATFALLMRVFERIGSSVADVAGHWFAPGCLALFLCYRPMWSALYHDFHPSTLGMPLVAGALLCLHSGSRRGLWICVALLLATKELAVATTLGLALYAVAVLGERRVGMALASVSALAAIAVFGGVMPAFRDGPWEHMARLGPLAEPLPKLAYLVRLALPLGLLPLLGWRALFAAIPTTLVNLAVAHPPQFSLRYHYDDQNCIFWIVAAAHGARWLAAGIRSAPVRTRTAALRGVPIAIFALAVAFAGPSPFWRLARWWPTDAHRTLRRAVTAQAALPDDVAVAAQSTLGPRLAHRLHYRSLQDHDFASPEFLAGERIVLAPALAAHRLDVAAAREFLAADARAELVLRGGGLEVYVWRGDP